MNFVFFSFDSIDKNDLFEIMTKKFIKLFT